MNNMNKDELKLYLGGAVTLSGAVISALKGYLGTIVGIGQTLGGAIKRLSTGNVCRY